MKTKVFLLPLSVLTLLVSSAISARATVVTFEELPTGSMTVSDSGSVTTFLPFVPLTNGYQGLDWSNLYALNSPLWANKTETNGEYYGMVSASNVVFNSDGTLAEIASHGSNLNFLSAYLTGAWNSNLNIEVQGFRSGTMLYDTTVVANATSPTLFTFNYLDIDTLMFNSFGGQNAGFAPPPSGGEQFAMDNFTFEFVPEPSSLLLVTAGALLLCPLLKRKRV